ncbi:hypothetical protein DFH07DRAFT_794694 [Mycena maculata]|uniref:DUF6534 domain-containing protein n=1 Tax=Mycena maculata TaxID=230809 RepID=A0AAD7NXJ7_9AGAR|nr:hypothetical protein DFH07DRAFT_794694 [Mycena maculata]
MTDVARTLGALLIGGSIALVLSGIVTVQCIVYFKLYPNESLRWNLMVAAVWILDLLHSAFIVTSLFDYFIKFFGDRSRIEYIPWYVGLSVVVTAIQTLIFHWYFAYKIHQSSERNWWITGPIVLLAFLRLFAASASTTEMIRLHRYSAFTQKYPGWIFTTGLSLSAGVDILITGWLCYFLQKMRRRTASTIMAQVVNTLTLYTLENGFLTCVTTTATLICWLAMPRNLVFLGLHFVIGKLYANSLLISLNTRKELREMRWNKPNWDPAVPVLTSDDFTIPYTRSYQYGEVTSLTMTTPASAYRPAFKVSSRLSQSRMPQSPLEVSVQRTIQRSSDDLSDIIEEDRAYDRRYHRPRSPRHSSDPWRALP